MKTFLLILVFPLLCNSQRDFSDAKHYYAGAFISFGTGWVVWKITDDNTLSLTTGLICGITTGIAKEEIYDRQMGLGTPALEDKLVTGWGACGGALALRVRIGIYDKKKRKKEEQIENFILKYNQIYL